MKHRDMKMMVRDLSEKYPWVSRFAEPLDSTLQKWINAALLNYNVNEYDHFDFLNYLNIASELLDKCLIYRREYQDLAAMAIRQSLEYDLFDKIRVEQQTLDEAAWQAEIRRKESDAQTQVAKKFHSRSDLLAGGFEASALANSEVSGQAAKSEALRINVVRRRWEIETQHQRELQEQHSTPGHLLNFQDRADRILGFLRSDLSEVVRKIEAARAGLRRIYGPGAAGLDYIPAKRPLDELVIWLRTRMRAVEGVLAEETDTVINVVIPLSEVASNGTRTFSVMGAKACRLKAVSAGLAFKKTSDAYAPDMHLAWTTLTFITPPQSKKPSKFDNPRRAQLDKVGIVDPVGQIATYTGRAVRNLDPRGMWSVTWTDLSIPNSDAIPQMSWVTRIYVSLTVSGGIWPGQLLKQKRAESGMS